MAQAANTVDLKARTIEAFNDYIHDAEDGMDVRGKLRHGDLAAHFWSGKGPVKIPDGLIHDWIGSVLIPNATVKDTLSLIQDYDNHKNIYKPEVIDSRLITRRRNDFKIYLRLLKKKIITVVLDTEHDVHYKRIEHGRWSCRSYTTRISEVENPGKVTEKVLPADTGFGYLWRLYSYWRLDDTDGGAYVECRAISLTRDIPTGLGWLIEPIVRTLPKESVINTLKATREAVLSRARGDTHNTA